MTSTRMRVLSFRRFPHQGPEDAIAFEPGVNVIVGPQNSGKTKLLSMLDYLMGDTGDPENAFGVDLASKYDSAEAVFGVGGEEVKLERRWKEPGSKHKVFVDDEPVADADFSTYWLERLGIPVLHFPQGSPYGPRAWPTLGWRTLLRHVYRRQLMWGSLADKQPDSEQHACVTQFLGIAENLFSNEYAELISKQKRIFELRAAKEQFIGMLQEVSSDLLDAKELGVALTAESVDSAIERLNRSIAELGERRKRSLLALRSSSAQRTDEDKDALAELGQRWAELQSATEANLLSLRKAEHRLAELDRYRTTLLNEMSRLDRAKTGGDVLGGLRITHCPACDLPISVNPSSEGKCSLCGQAVPCANSDAGSKRISFEIRQLQEELGEADELIAVVRREHDRCRQLVRRTEDELNTINTKLRPAREAASAIVPPEVSVLDMEVGRLQEQICQLGRIRTTLGRREQLSSEIDRIQREASMLEAEVAKKSGSVEFQAAGDALDDGINTYLNAISKANPDSWTKGRVSVAIKERAVKMTLDGKDYRGQLGGTLMLYFLFAYHYALLSLTPRPEGHFPGYVILDFPAELEDGSSIADKENFVLEPFISLSAKAGMSDTQVIAAGRAFQNLQGAHRLELTTIW